MRFWTLFSIFLLAGAGHAQSIDRATQLELQRLDQQLVRVLEENDFLKRQQRVLERDNVDLQKTVEELLAWKEGVTDDLVRIQNVDIPNFHAGQLQFEEQLKNDYNADYEALRQSWVEKEEELNWGKMERACPEVAAQHQEIKTVEKEDGKLSLRYLCYDGKILHMGTWVNSLPQ